VEKNNTTAEAQEKANRFFSKFILRVFNSSSLEIEEGEMKLHFKRGLIYGDGETEKRDDGMGRY
jgi:hypothetical protein